MAEDLMVGDTLDYCLVVAAEEADWLLCDAYRKWRFLRSAPPIEPFREPPRGTILSEGAGAILVARDGAIQIEKISSGTNFSHQREASVAVEKVFVELSDPAADLISASANGTFIDHAERCAIDKHSPGTPVYAVKQALGESIGASSLWQNIAGAQALLTQRLPGLGAQLHVQTAMVSACGLNQQVAGLKFRLPN
jgi:3-oxoacyl-(acyl-carrier-protein) synthase